MRDAHCSGDSPSTPWPQGCLHPDRTAHARTASSTRGGLLAQAGSAKQHPMVSETGRLSPPRMTGGRVALQKRPQMHAKEAISPTPLPVAISCIRNRQRTSLLHSPACVPSPPPQPKRICSNEAPPAQAPRALPTIVTTSSALSRAPQGQPALAPVGPVLDPRRTARGVERIARGEAGGGLVTQ